MMETQSRTKTYGRVLAVTSAYATFVNIAGVFFGLSRGEFLLVAQNSIFTVLFIFFGYLSWRQKPNGYLGAGIVSLAEFLVLQASPLSGVNVLQEASRFTFFAIFLGFYAALLTGVPYGLYGFYAGRRPQSPPRQVPRAGVLAFVAIGIVVGGLIVGSLAAGVETRLLSSSGGPSDVTIVVGSSSPSNTNFYLPGNFTAKVGQTVTWVNKDSSAHTVTSLTGVFDSGNLNAGDSYSYTFTKAGIYQYLCSYHSWMKGTIMVTSG